MAGMLMRRRRGRRGFTLVEMLVVVLILAILLAVALPLYLNAVAQSEHNACYANMQTIANAAQAYKVRVANHVYPTQISDMVDPGGTKELTSTPQCPKQGTYSLTTNPTLSVTCTIHGTFTP